MIVDVWGALKIELISATINLQHRQMDTQKLQERIDLLTSELEKTKQQLKELLPADLPDNVYVPDKYERSRELFVRFFVKEGSSICKFITDHPKVHTINCTLAYQNMNLKSTKGLSN